MNDKRDNELFIGATVVYMIIPSNCTELTTGKIVGFTKLMVRIDTGKLDWKGKPEIHLRWPNKVIMIPH